MFFYHPTFEMSLLDFGIEVPIEDQKFEIFRDYLLELNSDLLIEKELTYAVSDELLSFAHNQDYIQCLNEDSDKAVIETYELINTDGSYHRFDPQKKRKNFSELVTVAKAQTSGVIATCGYALKNGFAYCLGGGGHHAMTFGGRGFCLINDIVIAARFSQEKFQCKNIWIIDIDAHKGDGTAEITINNSSIKTLSIHMSHGWPLDNGPKDSPWFIASDIDIGISENEEHIYNIKLAEGLKQLSDGDKPDLAIVVAGSDPYEKDSLNSSQLLNLNTNQILERDLLVYEFLKDLKIPQAYVMSGGYGPHAHEPYIQFIEAIRHNL
jgi:acetoin utilization deacetylase AcuC-like enzyme